MLFVFTVVWILTMVMIITDVTFQSTCNTDNKPSCSEDTRLCGKNNSWGNCVALCKCPNQQACTTDTDHKVQVKRGPFQLTETYYTCKNVSTMSDCQSNAKAMSGTSESTYKIMCKCDDTYKPSAPTNWKFICG
uniref:Ctr_SF2_1 conopeptide n=2 Tax=Splinoconus TaxID=2056757 RepID=A0A0K8TTU8_CONTD